MLRGENMNDNEANESVSSSFFFGTEPNECGDQCDQ